MLQSKVKGMIALFASTGLLAACGSEDAEPQSVSEELEYSIIGIEPGAGIMGQAQDALDTYDNLAGWSVDESSTAGMVGELGNAIQSEEPIAVTGWIPHWKFMEYDLKFLEDPEGVFGEAEDIHTFAREGFEEDNPGAAAILDAFEWEPDHLQEVMLFATEEGDDYETAAAQWVNENPDLVEEWVSAGEPGNGEAVELVTTSWEDALSSTYVMQNVLAQEGYEVEVTQVDPTIAFQAIANGEADVTTVAWLPTTHGAFYEEYGEDMVDLGVNMTGTQNGIAVPEYVDIDSIEDLEPAE